MSSICTHSGLSFSLDSPREEDILIEDIAHALSHICRFSGHTPELYTVAQHSYLVAHDLWERTQRPEIAMAGLLHDAAEAYLGDVVSPLKPLLGGYGALHDRLQEMIYVKYGCLPVKAVKEVDGEMLSLEIRSFFRPGTGEIVVHSPAQSKQFFLAAYAQFRSDHDECSGLAGQGQGLDVPQGSGLRDVSGLTGQCKVC